MLSTLTGKDLVPKRRRWESDYRYVTEVPNKVKYIQVDMLDKKGEVYHVRKTISLVITLILLLSAVSCSGTGPVDDASLKYHQYAKMTPDEIVSELTI